MLAFTSRDKNYRYSHSVRELLYGEFLFMSVQRNLIYDGLIIDFLNMPHAELSDK